MNGSERALLALKNKFDLKLLCSIKSHSVYWVMDGYLWNKHLEICKAGGEKPANQSAVLPMSTNVRALLTINHRFM